MEREGERGESTEERGDVKGGPCSEVPALETVQGSASAAVV